MRANATILQFIKDNFKPGSETIIRLPGVFVIWGPNGHHVCLASM